MFATVIFERMSLFYTFKFQALILILALLNSMVFLLPTDCSECIGYSVTILLSVAVYLTILTEKLPETSKPTACVSLFLIIYQLQSISICIEVVVCLLIFFSSGRFKTCWTDLGKGIRILPTGRILWLFALLQGILN